MDYIEVRKSESLKGSVNIQGSKNSSLALIAASCLSENNVVLDNIPDISDVHVFIDILKNMGARAGFVDKNRLLVNSENISNPYISPECTIKVRPSYYFIGALLAKYKKITLGYPGGDRIGQRPIDQHIKGLKLMGAEFEFFDGYYTVSAKKLKGCYIYLDLISCGATINLMLAATLAEGTTVIYNAARDPEVVDTSILINKMGGKIYGAGTGTLKIQGVKNLNGCVHSVIPDRLIAGTYLIAAGITGGSITVKNVIPEHLQPLLQKLKEVGIETTISKNSIKACSSGIIKPCKIIAHKFPMLETDFQQPAASLLLKAPGISTIVDKIYPDRSNHISQLQKLGAKIRWENGTAYINGGHELNGSIVRADDIRAGACLVLAGLMAEGKTIVTGIEHIQRGYIDIVGDLSRLGAKIKLVKDANTNANSADLYITNEADINF